MENISQVLESLDEIINETEKENNVLGYFAVLYRRVTWKVKEAIENDYFDDARRMEQLDVVFAERYIVAYYKHKEKLPVTKSWQKAFDLATNFWPVTFQHLLIGMNAHINLDLGIAAAKVSEGKNIGKLKDDFYRINQILADLVEEVQLNLATIWPPLWYILKHTGQLDNLMTNFSMQLARDGAWRFAQTLHNPEGKEYKDCVQERDIAVAKVADIITNHKPGIRLLLGVIRLGEIGSVRSKMCKLKTITT
ncbi:hypothetical protein SAMN05660776_2933 [Salegentibacter holothuriorum]|uniref:Uncharacterized protein n=1 Tax=Salegentibacter holothuriorum TaxID=241145 RepID=A0A1T5E103_9FLAO|nr:DUF5995 family protein [Salegentibacter holothuriorum]SKB77460.1 hypothetical protein SAMN05660776_2933 [Salegentibacter holothuriorum]